MRQRQILLYVAAYLLVGAVAVISVSAQNVNIPGQKLPGADTRDVPEGTPGEISDWALAGIVWSDASLAKKVATEALRSNRAPNATPRQIEQLKQVVADTTQVIEKLEQFGWKQTQRPAAAAGQAQGSNLDVGRLAVGNADRPVGENTPPEQIVDRESPIGSDDPGIDDEVDNPDVEIDIEQYRVDDTVDETQQEATNYADAIEDGTEEAIAAAAGRRTIQGPVAGRISRREATTRSATMPYSADSIYDRDDFDPDIDYDVENPSGVAVTNEQSLNRGDPDDDIERGEELEIADGEDELLARAARKPPITEPRTPSGTISSQITRYSPEAPKHQRDADWVQLQLDANQMMWDQIASSDDLTESSMDALRKLRSTARVAYRTSDDQRLRSILQPLLQMRLQDLPSDSSNEQPSSGKKQSPKKQSPKKQ